MKKKEIQKLIKEEVRKAVSDSVKERIRDVVKNNDLQNGEQPAERQEQCSKSDGSTEPSHPFFDGRASA